MSFADDVRNSYVEKPQNTPSPNYMINLARAIYNLDKEKLKTKARNGEAEDVYVGIGIRKKKCIGLCRCVGIRPLTVEKEWRIEGFQDEDGMLAHVYAHDEKAVKQFFNIINEMAAKDGIEMQLAKPGGFSKYSIAESRFGRKSGQHVFYYYVFL